MRSVFSKSMIQDLIENTLQKKIFDYYKLYQILRSSFKFFEKIKESYCRIWRDFWDLYEYIGILIYEIKSTYSLSNLKYKIWNIISFLSEREFHV